MSGSQTDLGTFHTGIGDALFESNMKAEIRRNSSGNLLLIFNAYNYSKWRYSRDVFHKWWAFGNALSASVGIGLLTKDWVVGYLGKWIGINWSIGGIASTIIAVGVLLAISLYQPKEGGSYSIIKIVPSSGSGSTNYSRIYGHFITWQNQRGRSWISLGVRIPDFQVMCVQVGTVINADEVYTIENQISGGPLRKGPYHSYIGSTSVVLS